MTDLKWRTWSSPERIAEYDAIDAAEKRGLVRKKQIRDAAYKAARRAAAKMGD